MNKLFFFFLLLIQFSLQGQERNNIRLIADDEVKSIIDIQTGAVSYLPVVTPNGDAYKIGIANGVSRLEKGFPDLPHLNFSLIVPAGKKAVLEIVKSEYKDYSNIEVAPSKGKIYRNQLPASVPYTYHEVYTRNEFYPASQANLMSMHVLRDFQGQTIEVSPVQYNPITKQLRIYSHMQVEISYVDDLTAWASSSNLLKLPEAYDIIYDRHFLNYKKVITRYSPIKQSGDMLVVTPGMYLAELQPLIKWKKMKGVDMFVVNTDTLTGGVTESTIRAIAKQHFLTHQIAYMLIVGDASQIPPMTSPVGNVPLLGPSDIANAYITGNDHYPEFIVGRFSGESVEDIRTQVNRTIQYERYPNTTSNWVQKQIGISSEQGPGDDNQMDYEHICEVMDSNKNNYHYLNGKGYFDGTQNFCNDDNGYPTAGNIISEINSGIGLINYCGHGSIEAFSTSGFTTSDVASLTNNNGMWPIIFSTACLNGNLINNTCLGESLLRARDGAGNPTGAVASLMSSILQTWDPPMQGQDEINAVMRGARSNNIRSTYGALVASGLMSTMDFYNNFADPDGGNEIADTWLIFGDPSMDVRTKHEGVINCAHIGYLQQNSTDFSTTCSVEGAKICLLYQNEILAIADVVGGIATFNFSPVAALDSITVTATKQNYVPYTGRVDVVNNPAGTQQITLNAFFVFPNPVQDEVYIQSKNNDLIESVMLYDMNGRVLRSVEGNQSKIKMTTHDLTTGNYVIKIISDKGQFHYKLTK